MTRTALVAGVLGQDGSYLAEHLLEASYRVVGLVRNVGARQVAQVHAPADRFTLQACDLADSREIADILRDVRPDEVYNVAARASGAGMFDDPVGIGEVNGLAVARLLEAIRTTDSRIRFCQASSSEMFGLAEEQPQNERTPFRPRSPYGAAKLYAHSMVGIYRTHHRLFCCSAILFNHESPRRSAAFVTRKVTRAAASIKLGLATTVELGHLEARRDWGYAGDYAAAMHAMLQQDVADDYVVATGQLHSVRELCEIAFGHLGLDWREHVVASRTDFRAVEAVPLVGDASKARRVLGWTPRMAFRDLITLMVDHDLQTLRSEH